MPKISRSEAQRKAKERAQKNNTTVAHELTIINTEFTVSDYGSSYGSSDGGSSYGSDSGSCGGGYSGE